MKVKFHLHLYKLLDGGRMLIIAENHKTGFVNHRWIFTKEDAEIFDKN